MTKGTKKDQGKAMMTLVPTDAYVGMAQAFTFGAKKYGRHNFRNGIDYSRLADACMRHLTSYMEGEDQDPESSLSHLDHALASLAMLKFMSVHKTEHDDRWKPELTKEEQESTACCGGSCHTNDGNSN